MRNTIVSWLWHPSLTLPRFAKANTGVFFHLLCISTRICLFLCSFLLAFSAYFNTDLLFSPFLFHPTSANTLGISSPVDLSLSLSGCECGCEDVCMFVCLCVYVCAYLPLESRKLNLVRSTCTQMAKITQWWNLSLTLTLSLFLFVLFFSFFLALKEQDSFSIIEQTCVLTLHTLTDTQNQTQKSLSHSYTRKHKSYTHTLTRQPSTSTSIFSKFSMSWLNDDWK